MISSIDDLRQQLRRGCERVPVQQYQGWSHGRVLAYKEAVVAGKKLLARERVSANELSAAINRIAGFW